MIRLRDYQLACLADIEAAYNRGVRRQAIQLPTGGGKTILFSELIRRRGGQALVLAHRDELITQARDKLHMVAPDMPCGIVKAERNELGYQVTAASVQTLSRPRRLEQLAGQRFATVVIDEAHHAHAQSYRTILESVVGPETLLLGVSATLKRADGAGMDDLFDEVTHQTAMLDLVEQHYLADLQAVVVMLDANFNHVQKLHGDLVAEAVADELERANACDEAVAAYLEYARGRRALLFAPTVASAAAFRDRFGEAGLRAAMVDGTTPDDERKAILSAFSRGQIDVLCNCMVLTEGYDDPRADCVIIARPTVSKPLYVQMVGRGMRIHPDKKNLLVLDLVGAAGRHGDLCCAATLAGDEFGGLDEWSDEERETAQEAIAARMGMGKSLGEAIAEVREEIASKREAVEIAGKLIAHEVDLLRRQQMHWLAAAGQYSPYRYALTFPGGAIHLRSAGDEYDVVLWRQGGGEEVLGRSLSLGYAQGVGEDWLRAQPGLARVSRADASWRAEPASEAQRDLLAKRKIDYTAWLTKGEASDLIEASNHRPPSDAQRAALRRAGLWQEGMSFWDARRTLGQAARGELR